MKVCSRCKVSKEDINFFKDKNKKDGMESCCKECKKNNINLEKQNLYNIEYYTKNKEKINNYSNLNYNKEERKKYYQKNKNKILEKNKVYSNDYYNTNKDKIKQYYLNNKDKIKQRQLVYINKQYEENLEFKITMILRSRFYLALIKGKKIKSILELIGCSIEELKLYLEQQFQPEMTWENHGEIWEIDHIIGCCNFDLTKLEEQKQCFHYINLQPLFKTTEIAKSFGYVDQIGNRNKHKKTK
jgi:hypothetical protein